MAARSDHADLSQPLDKEFAVLGVADGVHRGAQHPHSILFQDAGLIERQPAVERGLTAEGKQKRVHLLFDQYPPNEVRCDRSEVELIGHSLAGLDGGEVGVDEHRGDARLLEGLDRLCAGLVELAGLADLQRARAEHEHFAALAGKVGAVHGHFLAMAPTRRMNSSKRKAVSSGPGEASGWNCTLKNGRVRARMPSLVPSLTLTNQGSQSAGSVSWFTA